MRTHSRPRPSLLPWTAFAVAWFGLAPAGAAPAVITHLVGEAELVGDEGALPLPPIPFLLTDAQRLVLGEGAVAVVLHGGTASRHGGPATVEVAALAPPGVVRSEDARVLQELFARETRASEAYASRGPGELVLWRPLVGASALTLAEIRWSCDDCGEQTVAVRNFVRDEVIWSGSGTGSVVYDGPPLAPGMHHLEFGAEAFALTILGEETRQRVSRALAAAEAAVDDLARSDGGDAAAAVSVRVAILLEVGAWTDALYLVDESLRAHPGDAGLLALRDDLETRVGLRP